MTAKPNFTAVNGPGRPTWSPWSKIRGVDCLLEATLEHESYTQAIAFQTEDFAEERSAFFETQAP